MERMKLSDNIVELAKHLGVERPLLYQWEAAAEGRGRSAKSKRQIVCEAVVSSQAALQEGVIWLREALAKKVKEADFFKSACKE